MTDTQIFQLAVTDMMARDWIDTTSKGHELPGLEELRLQQQTWRVQGGINERGRAVLRAVRAGAERRAWERVKPDTIVTFDPVMLGFGLGGKGIVTGEEVVLVERAERLIDI